MANTTRMKKYARYRAKIRKMKHPILKKEETANLPLPRKEKTSGLEINRTAQHEIRELIDGHEQYVNANKPEITPNKNERIAKNIGIIVLIFIGVILLAILLAFLIKK